MTYSNVLELLAENEDVLAVDSVIGVLGHDLLDDQDSQPTWFSLRKIIAHGRVVHIQLVERRRFVDDGQHELLLVFVEEQSDEQLPAFVLVPVLDDIAEELVSDDE